MNWYRLSQELNEIPWSWAIEAEIPPVPGTVPIPSGHIRLYHYTNREGDPHESAESLRRDGIDISYAKGHGYGEPDVIWASTEKPHDLKVYAEFSIDINDSRWAMGKPRKGEDLEEYYSWRRDVYFDDSILPGEILAVHEPWHIYYRKIISNPKLIEIVKSGRYGKSIFDPLYGPAIVKALHYGRTN